MSTEIPLKSDLDKQKSKKRKKEKHSHNDSQSRKRRKEAEDREEQVAQIADTPKRQSKVESLGASNGPVAPSIAEESTKKKHKKRKDKHSTRAESSSDCSDELLRAHSPFVTQTTSFYLALSPCAQKFPVEGLCAEHISPLLLTYYPPLHGVVLAYSNPRISEDPSAAVADNSHTDATKILARSINEYAVTFVWLTADFLLFRPQRGRWLEGHVSLQNESLLGLMCYNYFNAVIPREKLPETWRWQGENQDLRNSNARRDWDVNDESGYFVNAEGSKIEGRIIFQVDDFDATPSADGVGGTISIIGSLRRNAENET